VADHTPGDGRPKHRLWRIRAGKILTATGAIERPALLCGQRHSGRDAGGAVRDYVVNWAVSPGDRTVVVTNNDDAYRTAIALREAGLAVPAIIDARAKRDRAIWWRRRARWASADRGGARRRQGQGRQAGHLGRHLPAGGRRRGDRRDRLRCVAMSGGWSPVVHLWSHCGGKLVWDDGWRPFPPRSPTAAAEP
jgi:sarcosine oxidase, subunit alpha